MNAIQAAFASHGVTVDRAPFLFLFFATRHARCIEGFHSSFSRYSAHKVQTYMAADIDGGGHLEF